MTAPDGYEQVPYPSLAEPLTHPDVLRDAARRRGLDAPDAEKARVLELGCGDAAGLVAMGWRLRGGRFVGIDRSVAAIARGQAALTSLGLSNVELIAADLSSIETEPGTFDYVVAHGLASWVTLETLNRALALARRAIHPRGVVYLSYNVSVAWGIRGGLRDVLVRATRGIDEPKTKLVQARQMLRLLLDLAGTPQARDAHSFVLRRELELLMSAPDHALFHDILAPHHHAYSVEEMAAHAGRHELRMLAELRSVGSDARTWLARREALERLTRDPILAELASDVLDRRAFRATAFCRADAPVAAPLTARDLLGEGRLACRLVPADEKKSFRSPDGTIVSVDDESVARAIGALVSRWPSGLGLTELAEIAGVSPDDAGFVETLAALRDASHLAVWRRPLPCAAELGERPMATALARYEAARRVSATNLLHEGVPLDDAARRLVLQADGTRTLAELEALGSRERIEAMRREGFFAP